MKRLSIASLALALSSCAAPIAAPAASSSVVAKADTVILTGERGFAAAELVYTTAAHGVGKLVGPGGIHGATATKVRGWNAEARVLLVEGHSATDAAEKARAAARLFDIADSLNTLIGSK